MGIDQQATVLADGEPLGGYLSSESGLERNAVGLFQSVVLAISGSAPTATLAVTLATIATVSARGGAATILIALLPMLAIAWSFYRLNRWDQNCGTVFIWIGRTIGPRTGFLLGWIAMMAFLMGTLITVLPVGPSFLSIIGVDPANHFWSATSATALTLAVAGLAIWGIRLTARAQVLMFVIEFAILSVFVVIGLWDTFVSHPAGFIHPSWAWLSPTGISGKGSFVAAILVAIGLAAEWDTPLYANEESEKPSVNPGKAAIIAIVVVTVIYAVTFIAFQGVASIGALNAHAGDGLAYVGQRLGVGSGSKLLSIAVLLSAVATTQVGFVMLSRMAYSMGRERVLPGAFARLSRHKTPALGIIVATALVLITEWLTVYSSNIANRLTTILLALGALFTTYYAAIAVTNTLYYRRIVMRSPREFLIGGVVPCASAAFLVYVTVKSFIGFEALTAWSAIGAVVLGVIVMLMAEFGLKSAFFHIGRERFEPGQPDASISTE